MKIYTAADVITLRRRCGDTQEQFAQRVGVTVSTLNRWERSKVRPSRIACKLLDQIESVLGELGAERR
jgi:DNA-binding transcriptional regulator YiaG